LCPAVRALNPCSKRTRIALIENILFPVDFSSSCVAMAAYVKRAATLLGARASLIHVADFASHNAFELYVRSTPEILEEHRLIGQAKLDLFLAADFPPAECPRILAAGDAAAEIARIAREGGFDLIMMPTHAGTFRRMLLGSTTAKVLNDADCPVLTSQHAETIAPRPLQHREWLCAIGLRQNSERVLRFAAETAVQARGNLSIIHAVQAGGAKLPVDLDLNERVQAAEREEAGRRIAELQRVVGSDAPVHIAAGQVKEALLDAERRFDADVLGIGRSAHSGAPGRLRDLTYAMIRDSPFPVVSV
jgi:nucleotide-binding universal stress UspA family protein